MKEHLAFYIGDRSSHFREFTRKKVKNIYTLALIFQTQKCRARSHKEVQGQEAEVRDVGRNKEENEKLRSNLTTTRLIQVKQYNINVNVES